MFFLLGASLSSSRNPKGVVPMLGLGRGEKCQIYDTNDSNVGYYEFKSNRYMVYDDNDGVVGYLKPVWIYNGAYRNDKLVATSTFHGTSADGHQYVYTNRGEQAGYTTRKNGELWLYDKNAKWQGRGECNDSFNTASAMALLLNLV